MSEQVVPSPLSDSIKISNSKKSIRFRTIILIVHRWTGLAAFVWLIVLGFTGIVLDHPEWRWARQWTVTEKFASEHVLQDQVLGGIIRKFQVNPANPRELIGGGERGLWRTADNGTTWAPVIFSDMSGMPMVNAVVPSPNDQWRAIWLATDDGIWIVAGSDGPATQVTLAGENITSLNFGARDKELVGIIDKTDIFSFTIDRPENVEIVTPGKAEIPGLPDEVGIPRLMIDMHLGEGFTPGRSSMWINDYGAVALIVLSLTGLLYWLFPRQWQNKEKRARVSKQKRQFTLKWLYNFHSPVLGVIAIIPIVYLSVTGIYIDHAAFFVEQTHHSAIDRDVAPGMYELKDLTWQLDGLAADHERPGHLTVMTRMGLIHTTDYGRTWAFDASLPLEAHKHNLTPGFVRHAGMTFAGTHGGPNYTRIDGEESWQTVPGLRMMVMDAAKAGDTWILKGSRGFSTWDGKADGRSQKVDIPYPKLDGVPFDRFMADLHSGMVFHHHFVWVNDLVCVIAIFLCITGFIAWWRKKWV